MPNITSSRIRKGLCVVLSIGSGAAAAAGVCSEQKRAEVLAPISASAKEVYLDCSLDLPAGSVVHKHLVLAGQAASDTVLDCHDSRLVRQDQGDNVSIRSVWDGKMWSRPERITVRNCRIDGALRISGMDDEHWQAAAREPRATEWIQTAAPRDIVLENVDITGSLRVPLYLRPGVTGVTLRNSRIGGWSEGPGVYLDAETAGNVLENNRIAVETPREQLALDGSSHNIIRNNRFESAGHGGIYLYRNCGENGIIRQQTPSFNQINRNFFDNRQALGWRPVIWLSSRNGWRWYCGADRGSTVGSSADNQDFADYNELIGNRFSRYWSGITVLDSGLLNRLEDNGAADNR